MAVPAVGDDAGHRVGHGVPHHVEGGHRRALGSQPPGRTARPMPDPAPVTMATRPSNRLTRKPAEAGVGGVVLLATLAQCDPVARHRAHGFLPVTLAAARCEPLAQGVLQDLARRIARHGGDQLELLGDGL